MAMVLRFPERRVPRPAPASSDRTPAPVVILPCIRREAIGASFRSGLPGKPQVG